MAVVSACFMPEFNLNLETSETLLLIFFLNNMELGDFRSGNKVIFYDTVNKKGNRLLKKVNKLPKIGSYF